MRNDKPMKNEMIFNTAQMAELLNLTSRRVQQLAKDGIMVKSGKGKYVAKESFHNYLNFIQGKANAKGDVDYFDERALHERAKRQKAEMQLALMKGELHKAEDVEEVMNDMIASFKSKMQGLPSKVSLHLVGKSLPEILDAITTEIQAALTELSEYKAENFQEVHEEVEGEEEYEQGSE